MKTPYDRFDKSYTNCCGHMTTNPIYGKNLKIPSALESKGQWPWDVVCSIGYGPYQVCTNDESRLTLTNYMTKSNLTLNAFI